MKLIKFLIFSFLMTVMVIGLSLGTPINQVQAAVLDPLQLPKMDYSKAVDNGKLICSPKELDATGYKGAKDGLYPYPSDKSKYYKCQVDKIGANFVVSFTVKNCPKGLLWDDHDKICNYPLFAS